jgi:hypothetical protein
MLQPKLIKIEPQDHHRLLLRYETSEVKLFDASPYILGEWFGKLKEKSYFRTVQIVNDGYGIEWPDGQDIAPHELYDQSIPVDE